MTPPSASSLPWLQPGDPFPPPEQAWDENSPLPGLLALGGDLGPDSLVRAYRAGIFPWFNEGQPPMWWSPDPRMVLVPQDFRFHRSLRRQWQDAMAGGRLTIRFDHDWPRVIRACAQTPRAGQGGTWIVPAMQQAYLRLHRAGLVHSVETWLDGELAGGLYCVVIGGMVFGESMFTWRSGASKLALAALVAYCRYHKLSLIDCQQQTRHLAFMGAAPIPRANFLAAAQQAMARPSPPWRFDPAMWSTLERCAG